MEKSLNSILLLKSNDTIIWASLVILITLSILAYTKQRNNAIQIAIKSFFNANFFRQSLREETNSTLFSGRFLLLNSILVLSITIFHFINKTFELEVTPILTISLIAISSIIWYTINYLLKFFIARISGLKVIENESIRFHQYYFQVLGIILLPGTIGLYFFPENFHGINLKDFAEYYIIFAILLLLLNKLIQSIFQSFEIKISWFYIFLYICTLEILPLCIGFQLIINQNPT